MMKIEIVRIHFLSDVFVVMEIVSIDSRLHCRFDVFSTVHTYTFEAIEDHRMKRSDVS